ncbi:hypothetical protein RBH39_23650 [Escherichia coli]|uniref:hypothetical protein n=1 Tax=Escherichia coli TaxID=562 RepID=UPI002FC6CE48|nr:hypothetical protein [Escherichia coli]
MEGTGLPSGKYYVKIPYTIGWGADTNESEGARILGLWREVNPVVNRTGFFDVTFEVKNNCQQAGNKITIDYGELSLDRVNGAKKQKVIHFSAMIRQQLSLHSCQKRWILMENY